MMRRPPPRPGVGKKSSASGFKVTYSVNQLLTMGKELLSEEPVCPPPEAWEKYQFDKIGWVLAKRCARRGGIVCVRLGIPAKLAALVSVRD